MVAADQSVVRKSRGVTSMRKRRPKPAASAPPRAFGTNGHVPPGSQTAATTPAPAASWHRARRGLLVVLAVSLVLSLWFARRTPLDNPTPPALVNINPDEAAHRDYIRLLVEERGFVRFVAGDPARFEAHQPPLYYLLCVPVYAATAGSTFALRLVAALLQLATIGLVFRACRDLFVDRPEIAVGAAAFVAFLPTQAQLAGAINNDALSTLVCAALFWRLGLLVKNGQDVRGAVVLGVLLGVGLLTKLSVLQLLPAVLLAYALAKAAGRPGVWRGLGIALGLGVLLASPWLVRNTLLYGDPLTLKIYRLTGPNFSPADVMQGFGWSQSDYVRNVGARSFATFWYFLPPDLSPRRFTGSPAPLLLVLVTALGGLWGTYRWLRGKAGEPGQKRAVILWLAGIFFLLPFFAQFVLTVFQAQGRYFLPALLPVAVVTCLGWSTLAGRARLVATFAPAAVLLVMTLYVLGGGTFHH